MKFLFLLGMLLSSATFASGDWSESHGGDGVVSEFTMIARSLVHEMEKEPVLFDQKIVAGLKQSVEETIVSSADKLILDGVEKDAINHTAEKPYRIEVSRNRWLQYETSIETQERLVLHEYLFTIHIDDSDYMESSNLYMTLLGLRMSKESDDHLDPYLLKAAENCNAARVNTLISLGANLNAMDSEGHNSLYIASAVGCDSLVKIFLDKEVPDMPATKDQWTGWYAAFFGSLKKQNTPEQVQKYFNILENFFRLNLDVDYFKDIGFDPEKFPPQENACQGQTMFMRSIIGIKVYTDVSHTKTELLRNQKTILLLKNEGANKDLKDSCGKSANDYARLYNVNLNKI